MKKPKTCPNHPAKPPRVKGLCMACYMKQRRAARADYVGRRPTGSGYEQALQISGQWLDRFLRKIDSRGECHIWGGQKTKAGYGVFYVGDRTLLAHRLVRAMHGGDVRAPVVMHTCDNPSCVNPEHLRDGSYQDNVDDMISKGRQADPRRLGAHLRDRERHPRAREIETPIGRYASAALAAEEAGITARTAQRWASDQKYGWRWV